jgi:hypothetical protein
MGHRDRSRLEAAERALAIAEAIHRSAEHYVGAATGPLARDRVMTARLVLECDQ